MESPNSDYRKLPCFCNVLSGNPISEKWKRALARWSLTSMRLVWRTKKISERKPFTDFSWLRSSISNPISIRLHRKVLLSFHSLPYASNFLLPSPTSPPTLENTVSAAPKKQQMNNKKLYERKENIWSERQTDFPKKFIDTQHVTIVSQ